MGRPEGRPGNYFCTSYLQSRYLTALPITHSIPATTNIATITFLFGLPYQICQAPPTMVAKPKQITSPKIAAIMRTSSGPPVNLEVFPGCPDPAMMPPKMIPSPPMKITRPLPRSTRSQPRMRTFLADWRRPRQFGHLERDSVVSKSHLAQLSIFVTRTS